MKLAIGIASAILTIGLVWVFWLTPVSARNEQVMMKKSMPLHDKSVPAAPAPYEKGKDYGGPSAVYEHKVNWLDTAGKVSPLVSTGITVATFMRGRKRRKRHAAL